MSYNHIMDHFPPLRLLVCFEAFARHRSMRETAAQMNVSQPAISQAIKTLEEYIGATLLDRRRKPASLTEEGEMLARSVREGLSQIRATISDIRAAQAGHELQITVACTLGVATYWLMPRLPQFYALHPEITVNVQAPPTDLPVLSPDIDLALRYGAQNWRDGHNEKLFDEVVCPVGAPKLIDTLRASGTPIWSAPLIHVRNPHTQHWAGWEVYLSAKGMPAPKQAGHSFNNYVQAMQAAMDGRGLMLGWRSITAGAINDGTLRALADLAHNFGTAYYISSSKTPTQNTRSFINWIKTVA